MPGESETSRSSNLPSTGPSTPRRAGRPRPHRLEERSSSITTPDSLDRIDIESITDLTSEQLDEKPFGVIGLDQEGTILSYNHYESELTGRQPQNVIGKSFFRDVAPCTNVKAFAGRFREGVAKGQLHVTFPYRFDFEMEPRNVVVTLYYSAASERAWVFVREFKE